MKTFALLATLIAGLSLACGGNGGTMGTDTTTPPPPVAGVVAGVVGGTSDTPLINHTPLTMTYATVTMDGQPATPSMVQPGMVMTGQTTAGGLGSGMSGGTATSSYSMQGIQLLSSFMGKIQAIDLSLSQLTIMGQAVQVDALTQLAQENQDGSYTTLTLADFVTGDFVSIYGSFLADGSYLTTRVERRKPGMDTSLNGTMGQVANLDTTAKTFTLGTWTIHYDAATLSGTLANGAWAQVRGTVSGAQITATRVLVMGTMGHPGSSIRLRGLALNLNTTAKTFSLMSLTVNYGQATLVGTLAEGAMVEVQGSLSASSASNMDAVRVEVEFAGMGSGMGPGSGMSNQQVKGAVTALDLTAMTLTVSGTTFWMDNSTLIMSMDKAMAPSQLKVGDWVAVMANTTLKNSAGNAYATRVSEMATATGGMTSSDLMGPVSTADATAQTLVLNGFTISVTASTTYGSQGSIITASAFWSAVKMGSMVEARGTVSGTSIVATRLVLGGMGGMGSGGMGGGMGM
jgi:hypothetical protein